MLKKKLLVLLIAASSFPLFSQNNPSVYKIGDELKTAGKINSVNPASNSISDIVTSGDTIWLGTSKGASVSTDRGYTWTNFFGTAEFGGESISALSINKYDGTVWVALAHSVDKDGQSLSEGGGLKYSSDLGRTWTSIPQPVDAATDTVITYGINNLRAVPVTVKIQNLTYDIAFTTGPGGTGSTVWTASFAGGLRKSTDMGQTWQRVILPPDYLDSIAPTDTVDFCVTPVAGNICSQDNYNYRVFSVVSAGDSTLYVGTADGINKSTDNGISWVKFNHQNQTEAISGNFVVALGYNEYNHTVWGATWRANAADEFYGVSSSSDGGASWNTFLEGESVHNFGFKNTDVLAPSDNGVFRTSNRGTSWIKPATIVDDTTGIELKSSVFYAAAGSGNDVWLGSEDGLAKIREISMWNGAWKVYRASSPLASANDSYCYPNPFSPKNELLKIKYTTGGTQQNVTIRIFDFAMNPVRTVIQDAPRGKFVHQVDEEGVEDIWDGKDEAGSVVPNGVYFYRIELGSGDPLFGKILVLQ